MKSSRKGVFYRLEMHIANINDLRLSWYITCIGLAIVVAVGIKLYVTINSTAAMTTTLNQLLNQTQSLRTATGYGTGDLVPALIRSGALPKDISVVDNTLFFNAMGGAITVTGNGMDFIVSTTGINEKDCWRLARIWGNGDLGSTRINSTAAIVGKILPTEVYAACVAGKNNRVAFIPHIAGAV